MGSLVENAEVYVAEALGEARASMAEGGIPVGSVLVSEGRIIGRGRNRRIQSGDPTAHAEIDCLRNAGQQSSYKGMVLYSTLMPCHMCAGAIVQFGIEYVVAGEATNFSGAQHFLKDHWVQVERIDSEECIALMKEFIRLNPRLWDEDIGHV